MLDCLLDTRIGTIARHDQGAATSIVSSKNTLKEYVTRITDDFSKYGLPRSEFLKLYRERPVEVLVHASTTALTLELNSIVENILNNNDLQPHKAHNLEIDINFWPYDLPDKVKETILIGVSARVKAQIPFNAVYIPNSSMTPSYFKYSDYGALYLYDLEEWVCHHYNPMVVDCEEIRNPQFTIYAPAVWVSREKLKDMVEFKSPDGSTCDPRDGMQFAFKRWFHLELLDPGVLSIVTPDYLVTHELNK